MGIFFTDSEDLDDGSIRAFGPYRPWGFHKECGGDRSNYPAYSGRILDLKDLRNSGIEYFRETLNPLVEQGIVIASVPSHSKDKSRASAIAWPVAAQFALRHLPAESAG